MIGTGIGGIATIEEQHMIMHERGPERVSPLAIPGLMANAASGVIDEARPARSVVRHGVGLRGGAHMIGIAACLIACGDATA